MAPSVRQILLSILLLAFLGWTWVLPSISDASNVVKALSPRQDESEPINGCGARCYACGEGGSGGSCSRRVKRDIGAELFWHPLEDADAAIGNASSGVDSGHLHTRALDDLSGASENDIAAYLARRQTESGAFDLNTADDNSLTRQFEFSTRRRGLIIGFTRSGYLTGCTVLTVVSRRAVYMGHFWQNLGFKNYASPADVRAGAEGRPASFPRNVRNLITGQTPQYRATGPALNPSLYNQEDDKTYASILTPAYQADNLYFPTQVAAMVTLLGELIPGIHVVVKPYYPLTEEEENDISGASVRGQTMFEYDRNADGQGNADWRLWYEQFSQRGTNLGQEVE